VLAEPQRFVVSWHVGAEGLAELLERQRLAVNMATAHGLLAVAAAIGVSATMARADEDAWRKVAGGRSDMG
jgi:hypothetical protein